MPQNNKKLVTYGKSRLNGLDTYVGTFSGASNSRASGNGASSKTFNHSAPMPCQANILSHFPPTDPKLEENGTIQRKRRKCSGEEYHRNKGVEEQDGHQISNISRGVNPDSTRLIPSTTAVSSHGGDGRRCGSSYQLGNLSQLDFDDTQREGWPRNHTETGFTRKRLVDSLGTASKGLGTHPPLLVDDSPDNEVGGGKPPQFYRSTGGSPLSNIEKTDIHRDAATQKCSKFRGTRITYSRQRSFLNNSSAFGAHGDLADSSMSDGKRDTFNANASLLPSNIEDDENNSSGPVRSIHELRQAGDNARFQETIDSIFEDIEDVHNSVSGRCCSFANLCVKLSEPQFLHRFSEHGFDERLVGCTTSQLDVVSTSLALGAYLLVQGRGASSPIVSGLLWGKLLEVSPILLEEEDDILLLAKEPSRGLSKPAQASVRRAKRLMSSAIRPLPPNLSPCRLALECLKSSLSGFWGESDSVMPIPVSLLARIVDLSLQNCPENPGFSLSTDDFEVLELIFLILEKYTIISGPLSNDHRNCFLRLSLLHRLLDPNPDDRRQHIMNLYIRVILNLTNKEPLLCNDFATDELVSKLIGIITTKSCEVHQVSRTEGGALNTVILALGALINLAEKTELSRAAFIRSTNTSTSFLQQLLQQFAGSIGSIDQAHSVPEVHHNVVTGYLSILLLTVCLNTDAYSLVKSSMNGSGLSIVVSTSEKFLQYHRKVERNSQDPVAWDGAESALTTKLEHIIGQIRQHSGKKIFE